MRYFKLTRADGPWPEGHPIQVGAIIRVPENGGRAPGNAVWNEAARAWINPTWEEVGNPADEA